MISVGRRGDDREVLGLWFGGGSRNEMMEEENELEEGEACFCHQEDGGNDNGDNFDPDVALSYLDDKVRDVLGHFQKDFEGGVSAENLGAKFGGYGSFLPTHQRSPSIWTHPTPQKVQNNGTPPSPNNLPLEGTHQNSTVPSSATLPVKLGQASTNVLPPLISRAPSGENSSKRDARICSMGSGEFTSKQEAGNRLSNPTDQKTLKVRLKVGPRDSMTQTIYSDFGLDISPSSSLEDSPVESGGFSPESQSTPEKSPTSILQLMTSFPVAGGSLLSPLSDSLMNLMERGNLRKYSRPGIAWKVKEEGSSLLEDEPHFTRGEEKVSGEKNMKSLEKSGRLMGLKNGNSKDAGNDISALLKKEIDIETPAGKELVSNALKLPILSSSQSATDSGNGTSRTYDMAREVHKYTLKEKPFSSDHPKDEVRDSLGRQDVNGVGKRNANSSFDKVSEDKKLRSSNDVPDLLRKDRKKKSDESDNSVPCDGLKGRKDVSGEPTDRAKEEVSRKATSLDRNATKMAHGKDQLSSKGRKKSKGSEKNGNLSRDFRKECLKVVSSATLKDNQKIDGDIQTEATLEGNTAHKDLGQSRESHRDYAADVKKEPAEDLLETPFRDRPKEIKSEVGEKETHSYAGKSKERPSGKKVDVLEASPKGAPSVAYCSTLNVPGSDPVPPVVPPLVIEEWVCCDKCEKWRLLPFGMNPSQLPKKWLCTMLTWLPGMNKCTFTEDETTSALYATVLNSQHNPLTRPSIVASGVALSEAQNPDLIRQENSVHSMSTVGNKKPKDRSNAAGSYTGLLPPSDLTRKDQQASNRGRSLNEANLISLESNQGNKGGFQQVSKSSDSGGEKQTQRSKEKRKLDRGDSFKHLKVKSKRETDNDGYKAVKKLKAEGLSSTCEDWDLDNGGTGKMNPNSNNGLPERLSEKNVEIHDEYPKEKHMQVSLDGVILDMGKSGTKDVVGKKRKATDWQESQSYPPETIPHHTNHHVQDNKASAVKEMTSESERRKEKKAKVHKSDRKESRTSKGGDRTDKKGKTSRIVVSGGRDLVGNAREEESRGPIKDQQLGYEGEKTISHRTQDGIDSLKRDIGYGQSSAAATSSSSKVSGSQKSKANFPEVKGSPVESVSSSPLRISNPDKRRKDDARNNCSPKRCSDGIGDDDSNRSGTVRKDKASSVVHRESVESSVLGYQGRDANHVSVGNASPYKRDHRLGVGGVDSLDQHNQYSGEPTGKEHRYDEERVNSNHRYANGSLPKKSAKTSSSRSEDQTKVSKFDLGKGKNKVPNLFNEQEELHSSNHSRYVDMEVNNRTPHQGEPRDINSNLQHKTGVQPSKDELNLSDKKSAGKWSSEVRREKLSKVVNHDGDLKSDVASLKFGRSNPNRLQNLMQDHETEKVTNQIYPERAEQIDIVSGKGKSQLLPHSGDKQETLSRCPRPVAGPSGGGDASKVPKQLRRPDNQNGTHHSSLKNCTINGAVNDRNAPSPARKDPTTQAASNALREAKDLKHSADRVKNFGSILETTGLYFQAALKFLHGASLYEAASNDGAKHAEMAQSLEVYSSTAKLCAFVAYEYERCKEMAAAALAYKCMELAHMRVIYFKHSGANKDRNELLTALQMAPPGESPSSSASDVDNLNQGALDKLASGKGVNSPHVAGNHVIVAKNRANFLRLLSFAEDVNLAMEASRKSQSAFAAAKVSMVEAKHEDGISSIKRVLNFNFHDVQGLLRLVRLAMEAISH
ncbi:uncharacterized protein LOC113349643 isoform X1 [Papaver somniferum]|uniref:uncharacterized protein LOC113349643 isoform X1 n=1 Tax=Papaver somniferum TaxID=3469 RepID=UPI000E6F8815|nr:uncharacterized protein LOC113349643 isoform X1 [Papaver somniferum]